MLCARAAVHTSQSLEMPGGLRVESAAIQGCTLLPASCVRCCGLDLQHRVMLIRTQEDCNIKMNSAQGASGGTGVPTLGLVV